MQLALVLALWLFLIAAADLRGLQVGALDLLRLLRGLLNGFDAAALLAQNELLLVRRIQLYREALVVEFADVEAASGGLLRWVQLRELGALVLAGTRLVSLPSLAVAHLLVDVEVPEEVSAVMVVVDRRVVIRHALIVLLLVSGLAETRLLGIMAHKAFRVGIIDIAYLHLLVILYRTRARRQARLDHVEEREVLRKLIQTFCLGRKAALRALY